MRAESALAIQNTGMKCIVSTINALLRRTHVAVSTISPVASLDRASGVFPAFVKNMSHSKSQHHPPHCRHCGKRSPEPSLETRRRCKHCGKEMARTCIYEHQKFHCPKNKNKKQRSFRKKQCPQCKRFFHEKSLSRHVRSHSKKK